ncbi:MAG: phosphoglycerate dehydrogenase [Ignavibacteriales bacterium]|nr:MAG: phosphoglycerate dehydrogenase [Ignavibacteriales bacterium]
MKKIIITDAVDKKCADLLTAQGFDVTFKPGIKLDDLKEIISAYNALIVRSETQVTPELISLMNNMEVIGRAGTGVDNINVDAATRKGILVMNTPGGNTISTAEHTMALMLSMCRNIAQANQSMRSGKWDRKSFKGTELHNKTLGVIGLGKIGREVAVRSKSFGMKVIGYDPVLSEDVAAKLGIELFPLEFLLSKSDIITVHVPLTEETKYLLNEQTLAKCKRGVKIINCARGGIINEEALINSIDNGIVSSAAFDVYETEPPDLTNKLIQHPKIICTPHLGASTDEAQEKVAVQIAEQIIQLFNEQSAAGIVNASLIEAGFNKDLSPYFLLSEKIGRLQSQLLRNQLTGINITFNGELLSSAANILTSAVLKGFLLSRRTETINYVNAQLLSSEMGIDVTEKKSVSHDVYKNLITVECTTTSGTKTIAGTVFGNNELRIVQIDEYRLELNPEGNLIVYTNIDKPGMLATVGKVLADANINIGGLSLGRIKAGKQALTIINVDSKPEANIVSAISSINGVEDVYVVGIHD